jgi:hypothetical protein
VATTNRLALQIGLILVSVLRYPANPRATAEAAIAMPTTSSQETNSLSSLAQDQRTIELVYQSANLRITDELRVAIDHQQSGWPLVYKVNDCVP